MKKKRVIVAMSGGVDSSTSAGILLKEGYDVIGITLKFPYKGEENISGCCGIRGIEDARNVAQKLGIPFYVLDYEKEFEDKIINYFCYEYINGRTPNPCIICNEKIKFGSFLEKARILGADYIATGHYARIEYDTIKKRFILKKGKDIEKDQSYFLFSLSQEQLSFCIFPLGEYTKKETRDLAKEFKLNIHDKPGSQEICFLYKKNYCKFLKENLKVGTFKEGPVVDLNGNIIGKHKGIAFYTIGQRKGIGAYKKPMYVLKIDAEKNIITVGEEKELYKNVLYAERVNWIDRDKLEQPVKMNAKIRYKNKESPATIFPVDKDRVKVVFDTPQRAITPGQAVVFYSDEVVSGGGWIC